MPSHIKLGNKALRTEDFRAALSHFNDALAGDDDLFLSWLGKARALRGLGALGDAEDCYMKAVEVQPERVTAWVELITMERDGGALDVASDNLNAALRVLPGNPELIALRRTEPVEETEVERYLRLMREALFADETEEARALIIDMKTSYPDELMTLVGRGEFYVATLQGNPIKLIHALTRAVRENSDSWELLCVLGRILLRKSPLQNSTMGSAYCEDAWRISGENPLAGIGLVEAWAAQRKDQLAKALCTRLAGEDSPVAKQAQEYLEMFGE